MAARRKGRILALVMLLLLIAGLGGGYLWRRWAAARSIDPEDPALVVAGRDLYSLHCAGCHGIGLEGQRNWTVRSSDGTMPAPPLDGSGQGWRHPDSYLFAVTKHGLARFMPPDYKSAMPSFVGRMTDAEIRAVIAFIESTWPAEIRARRAASVRP